MGIREDRASIHRARKEAEARGAAKRAAEAGAGVADLKTWAAKKVPGASKAPPMSKTSPRAKSATATSSPTTGMGTQEAFVAELRKVVRPNDLVEVAEVRRHMAAKGWSGAAFEKAMKQAEHDYVIDLKTGNDPSKIPDKSQVLKREIVSPNSGVGKEVSYLQFVVLR